MLYYPFSKNCPLFIAKKIIIELNITFCDLIATKYKIITTNNNNVVKLRLIEIIIYNDYFNY